MFKVTSQVTGIKKRERGQECTFLPYYTACPQSIWRLTFRQINGEVFYFWISSLFIQIFRFLYSLFLSSNSLVTHASLSCILSLLFAGYDWFVGSATRYSRIRDPLGKMRFCVFAWIKYGGIFWITRTFAGKEYSLKPSFKFFTWKSKKLFLSSLSWRNMRRKIIKTECRLPAQNTSTTKRGWGNVLPAVTRSFRNLR